MVECLNCGQHRRHPEHECARCGYVGWAFVADLTDAMRRRLRERVLTDRRLRAAS
jgi:uncharacterized protein CbrC (UPF0167 family)